jgi:predicted small secreted protein
MTHRFDHRRGDGFRARAPGGRRLAMVLAAALALGPALGACTNTIKGAERDSRKIFGTEGGSPSTDQNPTASNAKGDAWKNPE